MKTLTLAQVRAAMAERNIPTLHGKPDQVAAARAIVGNANSCNPYLPNMIRALCMHSWLNTAAEWQRLEAAIIIKAHRGARRAI